jgi:hypothetical protein
MQAEQNAQNQQYARDWQEYTYGHPSADAILNYGSQ